MIKIKKKYSFKLNLIIIAVLLENWKRELVIVFVLVISLLRNMVPKS